MNVLWRLRKAFVNDIIDEWPEDKTPAYNTVSTIVRILQKKGFVEHKAYGRSHQYHPAVTKAQYQKRHITNVLAMHVPARWRGLPG